MRMSLGLICFGIKLSFERGLYGVSVVFFFKEKNVLEKYRVTCVRVISGIKLVLGSRKKLI